METSYHFLSQRIDLHLCDDAGGKFGKKFILVCNFGLRINALTIVSYA